MTTEPAGSDTGNPLLARLDALEADIARLIEALDEETAAALAGRSAAIEACSARKLALGAAVEAHNEALRAAAAELSALLGPERRERLAAASAALHAALARNEAGLRAATEAVRRIFESAAKMLAAETVGYGPARLPSEGHLFQPQSV